MFYDHNIGQRWFAIYTEAPHSIYSLVLGFSHIIYIFSLIIASHTLIKLRIDNNFWEGRLCLISFHLTNLNYILLCFSIFKYISVHLFMLEPLNA